MLIRIIAQYLESHRRLVIPQMGAFIVKEPGTSVLFSELLKRDDGVLASLLKAQGVNEMVAAGEIDRFVFEVRHAIQQGREFPLEGLGVLKGGPNGTIAFVYAPSTGLAAATPAPDAGWPGLSARQPAVPTQSFTASEAPAPQPEAPTKLEPQPSAKIAAGVSSLYGEPRPTASAPSPVQPGQHKIASSAPSRFQLASKKLKSDDLFADSYYGRLPRRPAIEQTVSVKKRSDHFIWIALIAALIALGAIAFGQWCDSFNSEGEEIYFEQPADDMMPDGMSSF